MLIKRLTAELCGDWLDFFDHRAFADHTEWGHCYCTCFLKPQFPEYTQTPFINREYAIWLIKNGLMRGYLVYDNGTVIGWCNVNQKNHFPKFSDRQEANDILSVVCFVIQKEYRGKGIAYKILEEIIGDAQKEGIKIVEAYPNRRARSAFGNYHGSYKMYAKYGFIEDTTQRNAVRKYLYDNS